MFLKWFMQSTANGNTTDGNLFYAFLNKVVFGQHKYRYQMCGLSVCGIFSGP